MTPHYTDDHVTLWHGDCLNVLRTLPDNSVHAVVTDPPYGLEFMGKEWDGADGFRRSLNPADAGRESVFGRPSRTSPEYRAGSAFQEFNEAWASECLRVLKPGGHLLAFGGTRTWHRLAVAIEDAGFEVRDSIAWLYGSGFPKSMDVSKAIDKAAGATREVVGHRIKAGGATPTPGNSANDGLTLDTWRDSRPVEAYEIPVTAPATPEAEQWQGWGTALKPAHEPVVCARKPFRGTVAANVLEHGTGALNIDGCRIGTDGGAGQFTHADGDTSTVTDYGHGLNGAKRRDETVQGRWPANVVLDEDQAAALDEQSGTTTAKPHRRNAPKAAGTYGAFNGEDAERQGPADSGGASRYFYTAKADAGERITHNGIAHPTVKPLDLMRWLVRLVTPTGGTILEPFAGSGTTVEAALLEGFHCIAIEREADYLPLITQRINRRRDPIAYLTASGDDLGLFEMEG